jgi:6-phosphogluconolactonase (cycloisomerase 2 family)
MWWKNPLSTNRLLTIACVLIVMTLTLGANAAGQTDVVYVESNKADLNSVLAFKNAGGTLTMINEFQTSGKGVFDTSLKLGPFDSDQAVVTNAERTVLYAVNSGSDSVAVFAIGKEGALTPLAGSPFSSGGTNPVSVGISRDTAVVVNKAMDPSRPDLNQPSYASFALDPTGFFEAGPTSTASAAVGSSPSQADISSGKRLVFDAQFLGGHLQSFLVEHDGSLTSEAFLATPGKALPLGLWAHPSQPILYVGFVTINKVGVYTFDATGNLHFVRSIASSGAAVCWLRTNGAGTRMYSSNTGDNSISVYDTTNPLQPVEIQHVVLGGVGNATQFMLSPREDYLYVVTQRASGSIPVGQGNTLHVLAVSPTTGQLSNDSFVQLRLPDGTRPQGLAAIQIR